MIVSVGQDLSLPTPAPPREDSGASSRVTPSSVVTASHLWLLSPRNVAVSVTCAVKHTLDFEDVV